MNYLRLSIGHPTYTKNILCFIKSIILLHNQQKIDQRTSVPLTFASTTGAGGCGVAPTRDVNARSAEIFI